MKIKKLTVGAVVLFFFSSTLPALGTSMADNASSKKQLIFASDFIRHGARTPIRYLDAKNIHYPLAWKDIPAGELTGQGLNGEKELGSSFRKNYIEDNHLLSPNYDERKICIRSTSVNRTIMSAAAALLGFYPLNTSNGYTVQIQKVSSDQDTLLGLDYSKYSALLESHVFETAEWKSKFNAIKSYFAQWSRATGYPIRDYDSLSLLGDTVKSLLSYCQKDNQCTAALTGLTANDVAILIKWQNWSWNYIFATRKIAELVACNPVSAVIYNMNRVAAGYQPFSYILYSAHDMHILGLLNYLGHPLDHQPPFGANVRFSLYKTGRSGFEVQVDYFEQEGKNATRIYRGLLKDFSQRYYNNACFQAVKSKSNGQCGLYDKPRI